MCLRQCAAASVPSSQTDPRSHDYDDDDTPACCQLSHDVHCTAQPHLDLAAAAAAADDDDDDDDISDAVVPSTDDVQREAACRVVKYLSKFSNYCST